jgi:hypothetical protein
VALIYIFVGRCHQINLLGHRADGLLVDVHSANVFVAVRGEEATTPDISHQGEDIGMRQGKDLLLLWFAVYTVALDICGQTRVGDDRLFVCSENSIARHDLIKIGED